MGTATKPRSNTDTTPPPKDLATLKRHRAGRRALLAVFGVVLLLGASGMLGVRAGHASATSGDYRLQVTYPRVTRPGHAVPLEIRVTRAGGFPEGEPVTIRMTARYFSLFDENGMLPGPSAETATGEDVYWEFDPPPGDTLRVAFDTRTGPNKQRGTGGTVAVLDGDQSVVSVRINTWVVP